MYPFFKHIELKTFCIEVNGPLETQEMWSKMLFCLGKRNKLGFSIPKIHKILNLTLPVTNWMFDREDLICGEKKR